MIKFLRLCVPIGIIVGLASSQVSATVYTGGLHFMRSPDLVIERQEVNLSVDQVSINYVLRNNSKHDITETLVFPHPVTVSVNDQPVEFNIIQRAISNTGQDVSNILKNLGVAFDPITAMHTIDASPNRDSIRSKLIALKLIDRKDETPEWFSKTFYYWQQRFPAGATIALKQAYKPNVATKNVKLKSNTTLINLPVTLVKKIWNLAVNWTLEDQITVAKLQEQLEKDNPQIQAFCPTLKDYQTILGSLAKNASEMSNVETKELRYDYLSSDIWATPVSKFSLRITSPDDMHPMLCWGGELRQANKNSLVFEAENFVPLHNLSILFVKK